MKTVTMDWDTYKKEIGDAAKKYDQGFDDGVKAADRRLKPILDYLIEAFSSGNTNKSYSMITLEDLMREAGEL